MIKVNLLVSIKYWTMNHKERIIPIDTEVLYDVETQIGVFNGEAFDLFPGEFCFNH